MSEEEHAVTFDGMGYDNLGHSNFNQENGLPTFNVGDMNTLPTFGTAEIVNANRASPVRNGQSRVGILKSNNKSAYTEHTGTTGYTSAMGNNRTPMKNNRAITLPGQSTYSQTPHAQTPGPTTRFDTIADPPAIGEVLQYPYAFDNDRQDDCDF